MTDPAAKPTTTSTETDTGPATGEQAELLRRLNELEQASRQRRAELVELARRVPHSVSRREVVTHVARDIEGLEGLGTLAKAVALRLAYRPRRQWRRWRHGS